MPTKTEEIVHPAGANLPATVDPTKFDGLSFESVAKIIAGAEELPEREVDALTIAANIMNAATLAEGMPDTDQSVPSINTYADKVLRIENAHFNRSDDKYQGEGKSKVYAIIDAVAPDGQFVVLSSGSLTTMGALALIHRKNAWGCYVRVKRIEAKNGTVTRLVFVPDTTVATPSDESKF